jgi:hypothetical protein
VPWGWWPGFSGLRLHLVRVGQQADDYLRHQNFQFRLQPNDGSTMFSMDATFLPDAREQRSRRSFESVFLHPE